MKNSMRILLLQQSLINDAIADNISELFIQMKNSESIDNYLNKNYKIRKSILQ